MSEEILTTNYPCRWSKIGKDSLENVRILVIQQLEKPNIKVADRVLVYEHTNTPNLVEAHRVIIGLCMAAQSQIRGGQVSKRSLVPHSIQDSEHERCFLVFADIAGEPLDEEALTCIDESIASANSIISPLTNGDNLIPERPKS